MVDRDAIVAADRRHVWHPYTSVETQEQEDPLVIVRAEGSWLVDADGRRYIDAGGSWWCSLLGHGHPRLRAAVTQQADTLMHCALARTTHEPAARLAEELCEAAPHGLTRAFFSDNGSTSVEVALKIAFQYWQQNGAPKRTRFVALPGGYHGDTLGVMSVGAVDAFTGVFKPLLFDAWRSGGAEPVTDVQWEECIAAIERHLEAEGDTVAGVVVEPLLQGAAGMRVYPASLLARLRKATRAAGTFLICDEVFTGFGRTGPMWASDHAEITPDLLCTAKGLSGGVLPFAATLATDEIFDGFRGGAARALMHGHTFCGNPLGAAVAREVLAIYREEHVLDGAIDKAGRIADAFSTLGKRAGTRNARSLGMMGAIEVGEAGYHGAIGWRVAEAARVRGVFLRPLGNTVYVTPALTMPDEELLMLLSVVEEAIDEALRQEAEAS